MKIKIIHILFVVLAVLMIIVSLLWFFVWRKLTPKYIRERYTKIHNNLIRTIEHIPKKNRIGYPVFYINLYKAVQRNHQMKEQFNKYEVPATRISAINGKLFHSLLLKRLFISIFLIVKSFILLSIRNLFLIDSAV